MLWTKLQRIQWNPFASPPNWGAKCITLQLTWFVNFSSTPWGGSALLKFVLPEFLNISRKWKDGKLNCRMIKSCHNCPPQCQNSLEERKAFWCPVVIVVVPPRFGLDNMCLVGISLTILPEASEMLRRVIEIYFSIERAFCTPISLCIMHFVGFVIFLNAFSI